MLPGLSDYDMIAARNGRFAAIVSIRWRTLPLLAAVHSLLIELSARKTVERSDKQKHGQQSKHYIDAAMHTSRQ